MNTLSLWTAYNKVTQPRGGSLVSVDSLQQSYSTQGWIPCLCGQLTTKLLNPGVDPGFLKEWEGGGGQW